MGKFEDRVEEILVWEGDFPDLFKNHHERSALLEYDKKKLYNLYYRMKTKAESAPAGTAPAEETSSRGAISMLDMPDFDMMRVRTAPKAAPEPAAIPMTEHRQREPEHRREESPEEDVPRDESDVEAKRARLRLLMMRPELQERVMQAFKAQKPLKINKMSLDELDELQEIIGICMTSTYATGASQKILGTAAGYIDGYKGHERNEKGVGPCMDSVLSDELLMSDTSSLLGYYYASISTGMRVATAFVIDVMTGMAKASTGEYPSSTPPP